MISLIGKTKSRHKSYCAFTPLEKSPDEVGGENKEANSGLMPGSAHTVRDCKSLTGFTLIELLLVVIILLILAGLNIPALNKTYNRLKLQDCALNILSIERFAKQKAIIELRTQRLNFDIANKTYWLQSENENNEFSNISGRFGKVFKIPSGIDIWASSLAINFYPNAESDNVTIVLSNPYKLEIELVKSGAFDDFKIQRQER